MLWKRAIVVMVVATLLSACTAPATTSNTTPAATLQPSADAAAGPASFSNEQVNSWLQFYYRDPKLDTVVPMVRVVSAKGLFYTDAVNASLIGFLAGIFKRDPSRTIGLLDDLKSLPPADYQWLLLSASLGSKPYSPQRSEALRRMSTSGVAPMNWAIESGIHGIDDVTVRNPYALDFLWGAFFATGDAAYVEKVIGVLADIHSVVPHHLILANAAKWSLTVLARDHDRVAEICRDEVANQPPEVAEQLHEILTQAGK